MSTGLFNKIQKLRAEISKHDNLYYNESSPEITDHEYDLLKRSLAELEGRYSDGGNIRENDPQNLVENQTVGAPPISKLPKRQHQRRMLSLDNAFQWDDVLAFLKRTSNSLGYQYDTQGKLESDIPAFQFDIICEPKMDGVSFSATYNKGSLKCAITRGDGNFGEDITANFLQVLEVPRTVSYQKEFEIRGEVYINKLDFVALGDSFSNPRNAASGSLRQLDPSITGRRRLRYCVWGGYMDGIGSHFELLQFFRSIGLQTCAKTKRIQNFIELRQYYNEMYTIRADLPYDIDGVVYKIDNLSFEKLLGESARAPRWAIAHKFPGLEAISKIEDILTQISRNGVLTPVAKLAPINIGGVLVTRATLHNYNDIRKKDFRIGDVVLVKRAGDVIPKVVKVLLDRRRPNLKQYEPPQTCPICQSIVIDVDDAKICSGGEKCDAQNIEKLTHFVSQNGLDIVGFGNKQIEDLYNGNLIKTYSDILELKEKNDALSITDRIENRKGWGQKSANNLFAAIERSRKVPLHKFITALGINHVGEESAKLIAKHYVSLDILERSSEVPCFFDELQKIHGIGAKTAESLAMFLRDNKVMIKRVGEGLYVQNDVEPENLFLKNEDELHPLYKKILVFTGTLQKQTRIEAIKIAENFGAIIAKNLTRKTDYLVSGENPGSKVAQAAKYGVKTINEYEWQDLVQSRS